MLYTLVVVGTYSIDLIVQLLCILIVDINNLALLSVEGLSPIAVNGFLNCFNLALNCSVIYYKIGVVATLNLLLCLVKLVLLSSKQLLPLLLCLWLILVLGNNLIHIVVELLLGIINELVENSLSLLNQVGLVCFESSSSVCVLLNRINIEFSLCEVLTVVCLVDELVNVLDVLLPSIVVLAESVSLEYIRISCDNLIQILSVLGNLFNLSLVVALNDSTCNHVVNRCYDASVCILEVCLSLTRSCVVIRIVL